MKRNVLKIPKNENNLKKTYRLKFVLKKFWMKMKKKIKKEQNENQN